MGQVKKKSGKALYPRSEVIKALRKVPKDYVDSSGRIQRLKPQQVELIASVIEAGGSTEEVRRKIGYSLTSQAPVNNPNVANAIEQTLAILQSSAPRASSRIAFLSENAQSENVQLDASKFIVEMTVGDTLPKTPKVQINIGILRK